MVKTLSAIGNSYGLIIERPILDLLKINSDTPLEIKTDGESLIIRPVRKDEKKKRIEEAADKMMDAHEETFRKLAK